MMEETNFTEQFTCLLRIELVEETVRIISVGIEVVSNPEAHRNGLPRVNI